MAIQIQFEGFVNEVKSFQWGTVARVSHSQRAKNKTTGVWETVGKDYFDVVLPEGVTFAERDLIKIEGTLKTEKFAKKDGTEGLALKVRAVSAEKVQATSFSPNNYAAKPEPTGWANPGASLDDELAPF